MSADLEARIATLLAQAGAQGAPRLTALAGGANNQVFRVDVYDLTVAVKVYFQHPDDPRDRLGTEFAFAEFAWSQGIKAVPQPMAYDGEAGLGVYEFIEGRRLEPTEVTPRRVAELLALFAQLNHSRHTPQARALPLASEACFSVAEHVRCVQRRIDRLDSVIDPDAAEFIRGELAEAWSLTRGGVEAAWGDEANRAIAGTDRRLSPSDFGFHNALLTAEDRLRFLDFEYAGWDDPAKTVCDLFCQPAVPVPLDHYDSVVDSMTRELSNPEWHRRRIASLLPVYQVKWGCILLNEFLPLEGHRRRFARPEADLGVFKRAQLDKARAALKALAPVERA